jgi:hypothetical protein
VSELPDETTQPEPAPEPGWTTVTVEPDPEPDDDDDEGASEADFGGGEPDVDLADAEPDADPSAPDSAEVESFARMEEIGKKLDGLQKHVAKRLGDILGEDVTMFEECEVCSYSNTPGWRPKGPYPEEVAANVRGVLGELAPSEYLPDPYTNTCNTCNGRGLTRSGSSVANMELVTCIPCGGKGWIPNGPERDSGRAILAVLNGDAGSAAVPEPPAYVASSEPMPAEAEVLQRRGYIVIPPTPASSASGPLY